MLDHYAAIGIPSQEAAIAAIERAVTDGEMRRRADGGLSGVWRDASGASVAVHLDADGAVVCGAPSFHGTRTTSVRSGRLALDPECRFCSVLVAEVLDGAEMLYPLAVQLEDVDVALERPLGDEEVRQLGVSAFGEEVEVWPDERTYEGAPADAPRLATQSLIPSGLFVGLEDGRAAEPAPTAHAVVTGVVAEVETRTNSLTGADFVHARLATYGADLDIVLAPNDLSEPLAAGNVVQGTFWLIARLTP